MPALDHHWRAASAAICAAAKMGGDGWSVIYSGITNARQRGWIILEPPPGSVHRGPKGMTLAYRRGDDFMRRGPFYALMAHYDQQERVPLDG